LKTFHEVASLPVPLTAHPVKYLPVFDRKFFIVSVFIGHSNEYLVTSPNAMRYASYIIHILVYNVSECHLH
ncbi:hypothetical protein T12_8207, partial [Trichinella patagoniensis]